MYDDRKTIYKDRFFAIEIWESKAGNIGVYLDQSGIIEFSESVAFYVAKKLKSGNLNVLKFI